MSELQNSIIFLLLIFYIDVLPTFKWGSVDGQVTLAIDFNDGGESDVATLQRIASGFGFDAKDEADNECILRGYLKYESNVPVTVDGCPGNDTFQVNICYDRTYIVILNNHFR